MFIVYFKHRKYCFKKKIRTFKLLSSSFIIFGKMEEGRRLQDLEVVANRGTENILGLKSLELGLGTFNLFNFNPLVNG